jgi:hypothetical protein
VVYTVLARSARVSMPAQQLSDVDQARPCPRELPIEHDDLVRWCHVQAADLEVAVAEHGNVERVACGDGVVIEKCSDARRERPVEGLPIARRH